MVKILKKTEQEIRDIIFQFLNPKEHQVFIFGSRAIGKTRKFSDYDIGIWGKNKRPLSSGIKILIGDALEESNLPYKVDVVDFSLVSSGFRKVALSKIKEL